MDTVSENVKNISTQFQNQSLTSVVAGFSFASAIAWMEAVRWILSQVVHTPKNGASYVFLTAIFTTLLSIIVFMIISRFNKDVQPPASPVYAVTGVR
jgi:uncharacterized BrkB/YihY/UPF0761 family membrane protein